VPLEWPLSRIAICSIIYLNELMTSTMLQKHWASADNIFPASEHMAAFLLCENHLNPSIYLPWLAFRPSCR